MARVAMKEKVIFYLFLGLKCGDPAPFQLPYSASRFAYGATACFNINVLPGDHDSLNSLLDFSPPDSAPVYFCYYKVFTKSSERNM